MLMRPHRPPEVTRTLPPHLHPHHSLRFHTPTDYHPYAHIVPSQHSSNTAYNPYTPVVPSRHASNARYHPYTCCPQDETTMLPPTSGLTTPYSATPLPYLLYHLQFLCSRATLKICLQFCSQPALRLILSLPRTILILGYYIHRVQWLFGIHDECNHGNMLSGLLCQQVLGGNW
ncbi:hypothetical protein O181_111686 [Austropuccinia psidii MF-1]|uniref:Uncharacterized protein n=1 Tax=Austropuccinia psidii MF-1 TaxID=1389203 RepID=A0A9Q3PSW5_9BASI|nr:hypothetical protein [Austropuccinia psidii MF-1]